MRTAATLALFATLLTALMPTLARAFAASNGEAWMVQTLCGADGATRLVVSEDVEGDSHQAASHLEKCGYCTLAAHSPAIEPSATSSQVSVVARRHELPARFYSATPKLHAWSNTRARAPPG